MTTDGIRRATPRTGLRSPMDFLNKDYQDADETRDSKLKAAWDNEMSGLRNKHNTHEKVSVLLLSWHPDVDDLKTDKEVTDLEHLFKETFQYTTERAILQDGSQRPAQIQLNKHLSDFVYHHDAANALLIIYYAGHGRPGQNPGEVHLTGSTSLPDSDSGIHEVVWNSAETIIKDTQGDVLVIFDCCYAGELERSVRAKPRRAFEFLAATSAKSTTAKPGRKSFTSALIHSLSELVKLGSFSTQELVRKIQYAPGFPENQCPRLHERQSSRRKIVMSALTQKSIEEAKKANQSNDDDDCIRETRQDLLVRYIFDKHITETMVQEVAKNIQRLINEGEIKAKAASWEGLIAPTNLPYKDFISIQPFVDVFLQPIRKRSPITPQTPKILVNDAVQVPSPNPSSSPGSRVATPDPSLSAQTEICEGLGISAQPKSPAIVRLTDPEGPKTPIIAEPMLNKRRREGNDKGYDENMLEKRVKIRKESPL